MATAAHLDATDELAGFAGEFAKPPGVYMDGNSLGLMCQAADAGLRAAVDAWRSLGIRGWTEGAEPWFGMSRKASALLAPLLGCEPDDVMVGNSTTVNLHQLMATFAHPRRQKTVIDATHFPTDRYAVESFLRRHGGSPDDDLIVVPEGRGADACRVLDEAHLLDGLRRPGVGFAVLPSVVYTTGQLLNTKSITEAARGFGGVVAWDCSHSAGVVPHHFRDDQVDLAFGCGYKYLNGGPGAAGWLYIHPRLRDRLPGMAGWFGSDPSRQFEMTAKFHPAADAGRYQIGTPHVFSLAPLLGSLRVINAAGVNRIRRKSVAQTRYLLEYGRERLEPHGVGTVTPRDDTRRGGHVTFTHRDAAKLSRALRLRGVVPDFRPPDMLRFAPAPLYTSFAECQAAVDSLELILSHDAYHGLKESDELVT
jgi:kynureninase